MKVSEKFLESVVEEALNDVSLPKRAKRANEAYVVQTKKFTVRTESLSEKSKAAHQELLDGYVKALNEVSAALDTADREGANPNNSAFRSLKIDEAHNINATFLHGMFFDNVGSQSSRVTVDSMPYMRLARDWGDFNRWQKDFIACGLAARNGWVVTCYSTFLKRYINVVVDCWEHTYYRDYLKDRKSYIYAMMQELNWEKIEERFEKTERVAKVYA